MSRSDGTGNIDDTLVNRTGIWADMLSCGPQANSTVFEGVQRDSGYTTKANEGLGFASDENAVTLADTLKDSESTEIEKVFPENNNENGLSGYSDKQGAKRQPKLTEKGKSYRLTQNISERKKLIREMQTRIANIGTLMNFDKNAELVSAEVLKLKERFNVLENLHGDIQELLCDEERDIDNQTFRAMYDEITSLRMSAIEWISGVAKRIKHDGTDKLSTRQSVRSKSSKASRCSINSSRAKALEAKAKRAELEARLAQLDDVEAAKKEAERVGLMAECAAANAVSKVYEDAIKEDNEQYLGSDDPDIEPDTGTYCQIEKKREQGCKSNGFPLLGRELNSQVVGGVKLNQPAQLAEKQLKDHLNPDVPELELPIPSPRHIVYDNVTGTLLKRGNFRLTKFISNDLKVLKAIPAEERTVKSLDLDKLPLERTLGLHWDTETDTLAVKASLSHGKANCHTRRDCLSKLSSTFDPLGLICPVLLPAKRLMQRNWQLKLDWDDSLPEGLLEGWARWKEELLFLNHLSTPRCYFSGGCSSDASFELHHFSDASEYGYGTVCYLRKESGDGTEYLRCRKRDDKFELTKHLTAEDLKLSAVAIVKLAQREVFSEEIKDLEKRGNVKRSSKLVKLRPILDNGLMRVGGRIVDGHRSKGIPYPQDPISSKERLSIFQELERLCQEGWPEHPNHVSELATAYWDYRHDIAVIDGILVKSQRILIPQKMCECLLQKLHRVHQGVDKSIQRARDKWFWPGMSEQIRRLILTCPSCLEHQPRQKQAAVIPVITTNAMQIVGCDIFQHNGRWYSCVVNYHTGYAWVKQIKNQEADTVIEHVCNQLGYPTEVPGTPHSQWKNGHCENTIGRLKRLLEKSKEEETSMEDVLLNIRDTPLDSNTPSPYELMFHRKVKSDLPSIPLSLCNNTNSINAGNRSVKHAERTRTRENRGEEARLEQDQTVMFMKKPHEGKAQWSSGTVVSADRQRSYTVEDDATGTQYSRDRVHIKSIPGYAHNRPTVFSERRHPNASRNIKHQGYG
ncbi:Uncharacterized protein P5673_018777 [Acropora cervicornis]|uniref:Integrase zinc-binding domain-containing protein n=1 Tax=Acropora cervicornis TaxID=6130 RepID=A0AAD9QC96_ACRCE|nr:Uncharacterized protein P5673_018777 [Acropora cervicornis]